MKNRFRLFLSLYSLKTIIIIIQIINYARVSRVKVLAFNLPLLSTDNIPYNDMDKIW